MCLATIATIRRETGGWRMARIAALQLFALACVAALVTYRLVILLGRA